MPSVVRERREALGLSPTELALLALVETKTVEQLERGEARPRWRTVRLLAEILGLTVAEIRGTDGDGSGADDRPAA
jgi:transcriptional regulator with XRE-family HTH domain